METVPRPGGLFVIFRFVQFMPYVAIALLVVMIALWIVFGIKKLRWAKISAIVITVLVVISAVLTFTPFIMGRTIMGRFPGGEFPQGSPGEFPDGDGEGQFRDFRDRQDDQNSSYYTPDIDSGILIAV